MLNQLCYDLQQQHIVDQTRRKNARESFVEEVGVVIHHREIFYLEDVEVEDDVNVMKQSSRNPHCD